jgi:hypothetical protein
MRAAYSLLTTIIMNRALSIGHLHRGETAVNGSEIKQERFQSCAPGQEILSQA